ncbi:hypothetical protein Metho_0662 [Methanomethylovorans hollandica DSM 15978]|uniref:Uncharacterized protein n=1 Tax=Methanomethylovorans hollandica (strain DSM 15978 / NBRC 107637 / DMS1) TaxID=867904 RepID=L0KXW4_METHD|nr:hypothetical protein [Methanomethylovorans hollandica]AGB48918.1 hypothetical protein Metho_0662 [Methanomethylovorans hollandica DSM 15978]
MKRLTISMSDALFDKLNQVENKSLFIRKLIEGELRKGLTSSFYSDITYEGLEVDIEDLHNDIQLLSSRLASIENQIADVKTTRFLPKDKFESDQVASYQISSLPSLEHGFETPIIQTTTADNNTIANELNEAVGKDQGSVSANISDVQVNLYTHDSDKVLPVHSDEMHNIPFSSVVNVGLHEESVCPATETNETPVNSIMITSGVADQPQEPLSAQVGSPSTPSFIMPELSDGAGHSNASPSEMPPTMSHAMSIRPSENDIHILPFAAAGPSASGIQMQPVPLFGSGAAQKPVQNNDGFNFNTVHISVNDRLQGNILMYLPHGARIKRSIIKGLVSRKFSAEEIDAEIDLMISDHSLLAEVEDGLEYLMRS